MSDNNSTVFENNLNKLDENEWAEVIEKIEPAIHEVDRVPTQVWFRFYPLSLFRYLQNAEDLDATLHGFAMQGDYSLSDQIDSSHSFVYGHRFWKSVKKAIIDQSTSSDGKSFDVENEIKAIAKKVSGELNEDESLFIGITAIGLMTLVQTGLEAFKATSGDTAKANGLLVESPEKVLAVRKSDKKQGIFSFLKTVDKEFNVTWDETKTNAKFNVIHDEEIATAAARDQSQNWLEKDERCGEGVIPVECRAAACGTCWVGVIGGAEKLGDVQRMERKQMEIFGYKPEDKAKPFMRLACQAQAEGSVSIVIPPWNGVFGKKVYGGIKKLILEPATTSAVKLREIIEGAIDNSNKK